MTTYKYDSYINDVVETIRVGNKHREITVQIAEKDGGWIYSLVVSTTTDMWVTRFQEEMILYPTRQSACNAVMAEINEVAGQFYAKALADEISAELLSSPRQLDLFETQGA